MNTLIAAILAVTLALFFVFLFGQARPALALPCLGLAAAGFAVLVPVTAVAGNWLAAPLSAVAAVLMGRMVYQQARPSRRERRAVDRHRGDFDPDSSWSERHRIAVESLDGDL